MMSAHNGLHAPEQKEETRRKRKWTRAEAAAGPAGAPSRLSAGGGHRPPALLGPRAQAHRVGSPCTQSHRTPHAALAMARTCQGTHRGEPSEAALGPQSDPAGGPCGPRPRKPVGSKAPESAVGQHGGLCWACPYEAPGHCVDPGTSGVHSGGCVVWVPAHPGVLHNGLGQPLRVPGECGAVFLGLCTGQASGPKDSCLRPSTETHAPAPSLPN